MQAVYVDAKGRVQWIINSVYNSVEKELHFSTNHFSMYGIGYNQAQYRIYRHCRPMGEFERLNNKSRFALIHPGDVLHVPED